MRAAAEAGELTHISVAAVAGKGPGGVVFSASYSPASTFGSGFGRDADPVNAMLAALADKRTAAVKRKLAAASPEAGAVLNGERDAQLTAPPPAPAPAEATMEREPWE